MVRFARALVMTASLMFFLGCASLPAAAQTTGPVPVAVNTSIAFSGTGFTANELISLWATLPDSSTTPLDGTAANGRGDFSVSVSFPSAGTWSVTAHGQTSGVEVVGTFAVGGAGVSAAAIPGQPRGTLPAQGSSIFTAPDGSSYPQAAVGAPVTFTGVGFTAGEPLAFWQTAPDSTVAAILGTQDTDTTGGFSANVSFSTPGFWQVTAHGIDSGHEVIGRYVVGGSTATSTTGITTPATTATPATIGAPVTFTATGFTAGETVSAWVTAPDSTVTALDQTVADSRGSVSITTSFATAGFWQVTAHGVSSAHESIGHYLVT